VSVVPSRFRTWAAFGLALAVLAPGSAPAGQLATWAGSVAYITLTKGPNGYQKIGVNAQQKTRTFFIGPDFKAAVTTKGRVRRKLSDIKPGMQVSVQYYRDTVFGADKAIEIDILNGFNLNHLTVIQTSPPLHPH
jgi:hypothetical protein